MMDVQIINNDSLGMLSKMEIDTQISTAKAYPRDLEKVLNTAKYMATLNMDIAQSCNYAKPTKVKDPVTGDYVDGFHNGPSVRLAEILVSCFGNIRASLRVIANDGIKVTAQARVHDLESNLAFEKYEDRSILTSKGKTYSADMQIVTGNAACAIAFRNAVYKVIPAAYVQDIYVAVLNKLQPPVDELPARRQKAINHFLSMGVTMPEILKSIQCKTVDDIGPERMVILLGFATSITSGEYTKEEIFTPVKEKKASGNAAQNEATDALKKTK